MISSMYGPDWGMHFFLWKNMPLQQMAVWAWIRNAEQKWCSWKSYSQLQGGVRIIYSSKHEMSSCNQMFIQVGMTLHKSRRDV
jgi:hypothetical protein